MSKFPGVYKRGSTWSAVWDIPDDTGGRRQKTKGGFRTQQEAWDFRVQQLHEINIGAWTEPSKTTVGEWLDLWLEKYAKVRVRLSSYHRYASSVKRVKAEIGTVPIQKITGPRIQALYSKWLNEDNLSGNTVLNIHVMLRNAFDQALADRILQNDPTAHLSAPKHEAKEVEPLNDEMVEKLLKASEGTVLYGPILTAIFTGVRRGEALGLRWSDVDMEKGTVAVRQQLSKDMGLCAPKTQKSRRPIPVPPCFIEVLRKQSVRQRENRLALGGAYQDNNLVWAQPNGKPYNLGTIQRAMTKIKEATGLTDLRFHDLRHTHATTLLESGVNSKVTQERLGHKNVSMTLGIYSHSTQTMQDAAVDVLQGKAEAWGLLANG